MFSLWMYPRPLFGTTYMTDLAQLAHNWRRSTRALGGYWMAEFTISGVSRDELWAFYHSNMGQLVKEVSLGSVTWEGEIYEMTIHVDGASYTTTLDPDRWHNKVKVQYTYPRVEDAQQGVLAYDPGGSTSTFQDTLQDFSTWDTAAPGTAVYECVVTNDDATTVHFYCGDVATTTNPNDSIRTYLDLPLTTMGFNGEQSGKTPISYIISNVERAGVSEATAWAETTDSSNIYGECCFIDVRGEMIPAAAEGIRARRLAEHAYPRSVPTGGGLASEDAPDKREAYIEVVCAGYVYSMNRRYMEVDVIPAAASTQIGVLVDATADAAELVTVGNIETNAGVSPSILCAEMPERLWDICEEICEQGNGTGARWIAGVYAGRKLNYDAAATTVTHYWRNGKLYDNAGTEMFPTMIKPNFILEMDAVPFGVTPGSGYAWDNPRQYYIEEVEFIAPRSYRLIPFEGETLYGTY